MNRSRIAINIAVGFGIFALLAFRHRRLKSKALKENTTLPVTNQTKIKHVLETCLVTLPSVLLSLISEYATHSTAVILIGGKMALWTPHLVPALWPLITERRNSSDRFKGMTNDSAVIHNDWFYWISPGIKRIHRILLSAVQPLVTMETLPLPPFKQICPDSKYQLKLMGSDLYLFQSGGRSLESLNLQTLIWKVHPQAQITRIDRMLPLPPCRQRDGQQVCSGLFLVWTLQWIPDHDWWSPSLHTFDHQFQEIGYYGQWFVLAHCSHFLSTSCAPIGEVLGLFFLSLLQS